MKKVTEKEANGDSSNMKIAEIKQEDVAEKDINPSLYEFVKDSDSHDRQQLQISASNPQSDIKKPPINEENEEGKESEKSDEVDSEWGKDPLVAIEEIVTKYRDFMDYVYQKLKEEPKEVKLEWEKWSEVLDRGRLLLKALNRSFRTVDIEMGYLKEVEDFKKQYAFRKTHIPLLLSQIRDLNSCIVSSPNLRVVSDVKNREKVLPICLEELEWLKQELSEILEVIQVLKQIDLEEGDEEEDDDYDYDYDDEEE